MDIDNVVSAVKQSVTALQAGEALGLRPNRAGFCRCPLHGDHDASLKLYSDGRGWCCFGCHKGGDVIRLVQSVNQCSFLSAVEWLNSAFNLGLPLDSKPDENAQKAAQIARKRKQEERERQLAIDAMMFDLYVDTVKLCGDLEADKEQYKPKPTDQDWDKRFCDAMQLLPYAKELANRLAVEVIGRKE